MIPMLVRIACLLIGLSGPGCLRADDPPPALGIGVVPLQPEERCRKGLALVEPSADPRAVAEGLQLLGEAAALGYLPAYAHLGQIHAEGRGVPRDAEQALGAWTRGGTLGDPTCQAWLGWAYNGGLPGRTNLPEAREWFRRSADHGNAYARTELGKMLEYGLGGERDLPAAAKLYGMAASQGNPDAQCRLGWMFLTGTGVKLDPEVAYGLFQTSAEQGWARGQGNLGFMFRQGIHVPRDPGKAVEWFRRSAEQGDVSSQMALGCMLLRGEAGSVSGVEGRRWIEAAGAQGNDEARFLLGTSLVFGPLPREEPQGRAILLELGEKGHFGAWLVLAHLAWKQGRREEAKQFLEKANGLDSSRAEVFRFQPGILESLRFDLPGPVPFHAVLAEEARRHPAYAQALKLILKDDAKAAKEVVGLLEKAWADGIAAAALQLGIAYDLGRGVRRDGPRARSYIQASAEKGWPEAMFYLAELHTQGRLVPRDPSKAELWMKRAADAGLPEALRRLRRPSTP